MIRYSVLERLSHTSGVLQKYLRRGTGTSPTGRHTRLLSVHEVAAVHREPGIISGYVPHGSPWLCVRSLFLPTNETVNFWTHFLPALYFVWRLASLPGSLEPGDPFSWPYVCYLLTCCLYPLVSSAAHAFSALSVKAAHVGFLVDYAAVSLFGYGVGMMYRAYCFPRRLLGTGYSRWFMTVCFANTCLCTALACRSRFLRRSRWRKRCRVLAYVAPYLWDHAPLLLRVLSCGGGTGAGGEPCRPSDAYHLHQLGAFLAGSLLYSIHWPERIAPGTFDLIGHSHNLLHVLSIYATYQQMAGGLLDLEAARRHGPGAGDAAEAAADKHLQLWATWGALLAVVVNLAIVAISVVAMFRKIDRETKEKGKH